MDWQIEVALKLGIISKDQVTEEMQGKLEKFEEVCNENQMNLRGTQYRSLPSVVHLSEHETIVGKLKSEADSDIRFLKKKISELELRERYLREKIYKLEQELKKSQRG